MKLSKYSMFSMVLPAILMLLVGYLTLTDILGTQTDHTYFLLALIIIFPIIFLIQGIFSAILKDNIWVSLGISTFMFIVIMFLWLNSSAAGYIIFYVLIGFIGFGMVRLLSKRK